LEDREVVVEEVGERKVVVEPEPTPLPLLVPEEVGGGVPDLDATEQALGEEVLDECRVEDTVCDPEVQGVGDTEFEGVREGRGEAVEVTLKVRLGAGDLVPVGVSVEEAQRVVDRLPLPLPLALPLALPPPPPLEVGVTLGVGDKLPPPPSPPPPPLPVVGEGLREGEEEEEPDLKGLEEPDGDPVTLPLREGEGEAEGEKEIRGDIESATAQL